MINDELIHNLLTGNFGNLNYLYFLSKNVVIASSCLLAMTARFIRIWKKFEISEVTSNNVQTIFIFEKKRFLGTFFSRINNVSSKYIPNNIW